ncbi:IclR family transcriptional regulator [Plantibacter sp. YIM 135347]|jgi:DNA-binding IclR family transcriptional regulator|uniref:IclR family transcriptional regulator n=1 Tax=Plantibacter sp. YIM 135347 TaxID=3423919 RepID=UPI003D325012
MSNTEVGVGPEGPRRNSAGLRRDLELLQVLGSPEAEQQDGLGVVRVAELVGRDKGIVSRSLATLAEAGLVDRDSVTHNYRLGYQLYALAARTLESRLVRQARSSLRKVVTATHETAHLCVLRGGSVLTLASEMSDYAYRGIGWEGVATAAWQTSSGRALISEWPEDDLREWYATHGHDNPVTGPAAAVVQGEMPSLTPTPARDKLIVTDFASLQAELARIRERGYAMVDEEFELGVVGVSAPIHDFRGRVVGAINVSAPKVRLGGQLNALGSLVARVAGELSQELGADPRPRQAGS